MTEVDVIFHLLKQEEKTSGLVRDAQVERDRRLSEARSRAETEYKAAYEKAVRDLEERFAVKKQETLAEFQQKSQDYRTRLNSQPRNSKKFNTYLDSLFFPKENS